LDDCFIDLKLGDVTNYGVFVLLSDYYGVTWWTYELLFWVYKCHAFRYS